MDQLSQHIAQIREDYTLATLDEDKAGSCPISFFKQWFQEAELAAATEVNALSLATVDAQGQPHVRTVLLKGIEENKFVFYTNYNSAKGMEMDQNDKVALLFFWKELQRQVRIEGTVCKVDPSLSDAYFAERPLGSRIGAIASPQSAPLEHRAELEQMVADAERKYQGIDVIPRPEYWGGYEVTAHKVEFWQGRHSRLHDRIVFEKLSPDQWKKYRIAP